MIFDRSRTAIKVIMLGGRMCGTTTTLASMCSQLRDGHVANTLRIFGYGKDSYCIPYGTSIELKRFLYKKKEELFPMRTHCFHHDIYEWIFDIWNNGLSIDILDVPGNCLFSYSDHFMRDIVKDREVVIIIVDTPYLMCCSESVSHRINCVHQIQHLLENMKHVDHSKLVLFVPVKCEKWIHERRINEVCDKIKKTYYKVIDIISSQDNINIGIIPVETIGGVEFAEMQYMPDTIGDFIYGFKKPIELFKKIKSNDQLLQPKNCEQILLHIINYWVINTLSKKSKSFTQYFSNIRNRRLARHLEQILYNLSKEGLFKINTEEIQYLTTEYNV